MSVYSASILEFKTDIKPVNFEDLLDVVFKPARQFLTENAVNDVRIGCDAGKQLLSLTVQEFLDKRVIQVSTAHCEKMSRGAFLIYYG